ncbi:MAG TPA: SRPBCC domain-containing protein [Bacteroidia bacterium]|jgi:uncharacterized protein YndB with AHSA1/START domain|nr:SRPBCC domain-containing protein [Bacteroidia bacterium]
MVTNNEQVVIERNFDVPAVIVWNAITNRDQVAKWYFDLKEFKPEVGFEFGYEGGPPEKIYIHKCKITEVVYSKRITYSWRYEGYEGISYVTFELFADGDNQTRLKLTHSGLETFPQNNPDLAKHNFLAGWTDIIGRSLKGYLEK